MMYKIGDEIEIECYINAMYIEKCDSGFNHESRKYFLRYTINDLSAGMYNYEDLIICEGAAWVGAKVKVKARIIEINGDLYHVKLPNGDGDVINKAHLLKRFKKEDRVRIDCQIAAYDYYEDREHSDQTKTKLYIRLPNVTGVYVLNTLYRPKDLEKKYTIHIIGKVIGVYDNAINVYAELDDNNITFRITDEYFDKVEVVE